jgi:hypothetical protein
MKEKDVEMEQGFYQECAKLLDCAEHTYREFPYRKRTRWNNRTAGNGRFPGNGLIRMYASNLIHVNLHHPKVCGQFKSADDVFAAINTALEKQK